MPAVKRGASLANDPDAPLFSALVAPDKHSAGSERHSDRHSDRHSNSSLADELNLHLGDCELGGDRAADSELGGDFDLEETSAETSWLEESSPISNSQADFIGAIWA